MKLLKDYSTNGSLFHVLDTIQSFKTSQDWKKSDFKVASKKEKNIELLDLIESNLIVLLLFIIHTYIDR